MSCLSCLYAFGFSYLKLDTEDGKHLNNLTLTNHIPIYFHNVEAFEATAPCCLLVQRACSPFACLYRCRLTKCFPGLLKNCYQITPPRTCKHYQPQNVQSSKQIEIARITTSGNVHRIELSIYYLWGYLGIYDFSKLYCFMIVANSRICEF